MRFVVLVPPWDLIIMGIVVVRMLVNILLLQSMLTVLWLSSSIYEDLRSENRRQKESPFDWNEISSSIMTFVSPVAAISRHTFDLCPDLLQL